MIVAMNERVRVDKWLWAARLFKTRSQAADAVSVGRVRINGQRSKPAREAHIGDLVEVSLADGRLEIVIRDLATQRGSAAVARQLFTETEESVERRERAVAQRRLAAEPAGSLKGRPTKRDGRALRSLRQSGSA